MTKIVALRARAKTSFAEREGVNLTFLPFFAVAVVDALKAHPNVNASYNEDSKEITYYDAEHLGFAVDTEQGLLSPVIHNAGDLSLAGLARAIADIAARARSGDLKPDELSGGTFTITNIGSQGALFDTPILVPPQAAMLGTGAIVKRPRVVVDDTGNESIGVRSICLPAADLRPPAHRRRGRGSLPDHDQAAARRGRVRGGSGTVETSGHRCDCGVLGTDRLGAGLRAADHRPPGGAHRAPGAVELRRAVLESGHRGVRRERAARGRRRGQHVRRQRRRQTVVGRVQTEPARQPDRPHRGAVRARWHEAGVGVLVNASAVGYYGDTGNRIADETAPQGRGFLAQLCRDWEAATAPAQHAGVRVVLTRTGLVLSPRGGMLNRLRPLFSLGLGARLGNGRQYMPWISLEDQVRALLFAIFHDDALGSGEFHRTCTGDELRVHGGDGPCGEPADAADGSGLRVADAAGRVRRGRSARRAAGHPRGARTRRLRVPPQHRRRGAGLRHEYRRIVSSIRSATAPIDVRRLGTVDYEDAWALQRELADARVAGGPDTLLLLEHPSVYTAGRRTLPEERPVDGTAVIDTDRGGKITWHGPGQLVGYPIVGLAEPLDVVNFVRRLEESLIHVCAELGLETVRVAGPVGCVGACGRDGPGRARSARSASGCRGRRHCTASR